MKKVIVLFMLFFFIFSTSFVFPLYASAYNGSSAANYAQEWAYSYNPQYPVPPNREDCTNFVSQCIRAGGISYMWDGNPTTYLPWWYILYEHGSRSFTDAVLLIKHFNFVRNVPYGEAQWKEGTLYSCPYSREGDIMQIAVSSIYPPSMDDIYHSRIVVYLSGGIPYCAQHTTNYYGVRWDLRTNGESLGTLGKYVTVFYWTPHN